MRFVWAVLAFVLASLLIGAGIAQRTVFLGPNTQQTTLEIERPAPYTLIDGAVLRTQEGAQTLLVRGEGEIFAAYGRTTDLEAWLSDAVHNAIAVDDGEIVVRAVEPALPEPETEPEAETEEQAEDAAEETAASDDDVDETRPGYPERNPAGSDLWLDEFTDADALIANLQLPEGMSVLIARDGIEDAPVDIAVSWPLDNSTPWAGPLMVAGGILMLFGIVMYILGIRYQRRGGGPRRKGPGPLPPTEPIDMELLRAEERAALPAGRSSEVERTSRQRLRVAVPAAGLAIALLTGCSADSWPQLSMSADPTPEPTETVIAPENQQAPAITESQAARILKSIADTVATADEERDADLLATRMTGTPLDERKTNYTLRGSLSDHPAPKPIPTESIEVLLPEAKDDWPRTVLIVSEEVLPVEAQEEEADGEEAEEGQGESTDPTASLMIFTLVQESPWEPYKLTYIADMQPAVTIPNLAPAWLGTQLIPPASPFLSVSPEELSAAYADVVDKGEQSEFAGLFDEQAHAVAERIRTDRSALEKALADHGAANTSQASFSTKQTSHEPISLGTLDSGAIVALDLFDTEQVTPTNNDAVIQFASNEVAKALTGASEASKGVESVYSLQLFFSVPSQGSNEPISLLAVQQSILSVKVLQ